jgi:transcriptional regulator
MATTMYVPSSFEADAATIDALLRSARAADLVTPTANGLVATTLPLLFDPEAGPAGSLLGHVSRANDHWRADPTGESLAILRGADGYVSPGWYAAKREHGRVVPTWDYTLAHVHGRLLVHDDPDWLASLVRRLTDLHEAGLARPWSVDDAPAEFVAGQLRGIVGLELVVSRVEAKAKLSQNRSPADIDGVVAGLREAGLDQLAEDVDDARR